MERNNYINAYRYLCNEFLFEFLFCLPIFLLLLGKIYEICESDIVSVEMKIEDIIILTSNFILAIILIYRLSKKKE